MNKHSRPGQGTPGLGQGFHRRQGMLSSREKAKNTRGALQRIWIYLKGHALELVLVFLLVVLSTMLSLIGPYLIGLAIDSMGIGAGVVDFPLLAKILVGLLVVYTLGPLMAWLQNYIMAALAHVTIQDMRRDLFGQLQTLPLRFFDQRPRGDIMSRLTNDMDNISGTLNHGVTNIFSSIITVLGALTMMVILSPVLTLISLLVVPPGIVLTQRVAARTRRYFLEQQRELGMLNGYIEEMISGQRVIKAYAREQKVIQDFNEKNTRLKNVGTLAQIFSGLIFPLMNLINNLSFALVAGVGGYMAVKGTISVGMIAAFLNYSKQLARPINDLANQFNLLQSALAGAERIFEVLDESPETTGSVEPPDSVHSPASLNQVTGEVEFRNVSFGYEPGQPVLKNINLKALPGQTIALVGPTGSGKTTVVNLLMRFYDPDNGTILIDDRDIGTIPRAGLRSALGIVLQDTYLFSGTVRENIRYGRLTATDAQVEAAAGMANAAPFIQRLPQAYDTVLSEDGGNLSQGQCQLLAIARAILADPAILILDEATSSVDTRTEMHIQQAIFSLMQGRTSIVIAHRLSTIRGADQILFIKEGEIVEQGTHQELLEARGFYYDLYTSQSRGIKN
ncbi:MAG: ABC transporter ATP-binding protein [Desulfotomaculaceae bacterium]